MYFPKVTKVTPAISDLKGKLAALELEQALKKAAEQEHAEACALAAKITALEEQKTKKAADDFAAAAATETAQTTHPLQYSTPLPPSSAQELQPSFD